MKIQKNTKGLLRKHKQNMIEKWRSTNRFEIWRTIITRRLIWNIKTGKITSST